MRASAIAAAVALTLSACGGGGHEARPSTSGQAIRPKFAPVSSTTAAPPTASTSVPASGPVTPPTSTAPTTSAPAGAATTATITDPPLDTTPSPFDRPPAWADILGARLTRRADGFELRVRLGGGDAPESSGSDDHTMNVASFYDVDGDGSIDYEVWANVASGGWGSSYFDDSKQGGRYQDESGVKVTTEGDEVVLRFPLTHLASAQHLRWSVASEWGRYSLIGSDQMARDQAPDGGGAADFPSP